MADDWVVSVQRELAKHDNLDADSTDHIFRVPSPLRHVRPLLFDPQLVTIGPYHISLLFDLSKPRYSDMERYKVMAARAIAEHLRNADFMVLIREIVANENQVRSYYDRGLQPENLSTERLAYIMALDASFIVAVLFSYFYEHATVRKRECAAKHLHKLPSSFAPIYSRRLSLPVRKSIIQDLLLLENQIPLFLLRNVIIMDERCESVNEAEALLEFFIAEVAFRALPFTNSERHVAFGIQGLGRNGKHLLDCMYTIVTRTSRRIDLLGKDLEPVRVPSALQLHNAGVKFEGHQGSLMDIHFEHSTLFIPKIHVDDDTERLFRNLVAYESSMTDKVHVLSYLHFMNYLINTPEDVGLLVEQGVMTQTIGSNKHVTKMWNELCLNTVCIFSKQYGKVARAAKERHERKLRGLISEFRRRYLSRPWLIVSLISGASLLVMTFLITWYTIKLYDKEE